MHAARLSQRPDDRLWTQLRSSRSVSALLEVVRASNAASLVSGIPAAGSADDVELAFRQQLRTRIAEVAAWSPSEWRPALLYTRHLVDLPALQHLLSDEPPPRWIAVDPALAALARPERIAALVGLAGAPDFTEELLWTRFTPAQRREIEDHGRVVLPSDYDPDGYLYTRALIEDGQNHLLLGRPIPIDVPVRLLHGMRDESVPWRLSLRLAERLSSRDVAVTLVKDGDHRLSTPADLALLARTLDALTGS